MPGGNTPFHGRCSPSMSRVLALFILIFHYKPAWEISKYCKYISICRRLFVFGVLVETVRSFVPTQGRPQSIRNSWEYMLFSFLLQNLWHIQIWMLQMATSHLTLQEKHCLSTLFEWSEEPPVEPNGRHTLLPPGMYIQLSAFSCTYPNLLKFEKVVSIYKDGCPDKPTS